MSTRFLFPGSLMTDFAVRTSVLQIITMERLRQNIEEITPVSDEEMSFIHSFFSRKRVRRCQYLVQEGDKVQYEYLVLSGIYRVYYLDDGGKEHIIKFAAENCWMSDYKALFQHDPAGMFIECMEAGEVLCLTLYGREQLSAELHKMEHFFKVRLTNEYVALEERVKLLLSNTARQRYEAFVQLHPGLLQRIPKKLLAAYLGVCRETLSRLYLSC